MGCNASTESIHPGELPCQTTTLEESCDLCLNDNTKSSCSATYVEWELVEKAGDARQRYVEEGTLSVDASSGHLELRSCLDNCVPRDALKKFAIQVNRSETLLCWEAIQDMRAVPHTKGKWDLFYLIYNEFLREGSTQFVDCVLGTGIVEEFESFLHRNEECEFPLELMFTLQRRCFCSLYVDVFVSFKNSNEFRELLRTFRRRYNCSSENDYEYYGKIYTGSFGVLVRCKKKSTKKAHTMRIQMKSDMLKFCGNGNKVDVEKRAFINSSCAFIPQLSYSFATNNCVAIVFDPIDGVLLEDILNQSPGGRLGNELLIRFFVAELYSALAHLHDRDMILRDLKPSNIMIDKSGHVQLFNLRSVKYAAVAQASSMGGGVYGSPFFAPTLDRRTRSLKWEHKDDELIGQFLRTTVAQARAYSIVGTYGYMAPEVICMAAMNTFERKGYSFEVDYWSLGAIMYRMITGRLPVVDNRVDSYLKQVFLAENLRHNVLIKSDLNSFANNFAQLCGSIRYPETLSPECINVLSGFLSVIPGARLGNSLYSTGTQGGGCTPPSRSYWGVPSVQASYSEKALELYGSIVKNLPYFQGIDWALLDNGFLENPEFQRLSNDVHSSFDQFNEEEIVSWEQIAPSRNSTDSNDADNDDQSDIFLAWNYTSYNNLVIEKVCYENKNK